MRHTLMLMGILATISLPALAARRTTVEQLHQIVSSAASTHKTDDAVAAQVIDVELSEQVSAAELNWLIAASPGPKTTEALHVVADQSVFLDLPASELPVRPVPDVAAQKYMLNQTIHYVARTLHSLPDFLATRETAHYDDAPRPAMERGLHFLTSFEVPIAYRDGRETDDPSLAASTAQVSKVSGKKGHNKPAPSPSVGLTSWGEFGPILEIVLLDASKGKFGWSHWEQEDGKFLAVFQFAAVRANSHYSVQYEDRPQGDRVASSYGSGNNESISAGQQKDTDAILHKDIVAYHGRLTIDPDTGIVRRIAIEAELPADSYIQRAAIMVEYGPIKIGDSERICPVRSASISLSDFMFKAAPTAPMIRLSRLQLNDVKFTNYRRFGSESTLVMSAADVKPDAPASAPAPAETASAEPQPVAAQPDTVPPTSEAAANPAPPAAETAEVSKASGDAPPPSAIADAGETDEEIIVRDVNSLPGMGNPDTAAGSSPAGGNFTLQVTTRLVNLGLIAVDKHGKPVNDLKPEEIEIYDNGRKQRISAFRHNNPSASTTQTTQPSEPELTYTNTAGTVQATQESPDLLVLLIDESHLQYNDLNRARNEMQRFLKATRPNSRIALYSMNEHGFRVIQDVTDDHALVETKLAAWMPSAAGASQAAELDTRNRQQFDYVLNPEDFAYVNGHHDDNPDTKISADPQLRQLGDNPLAQALGAMVTVARHFAPVKGHKSLVWISGDSVLYDFSDQTVSIERTVKDWTSSINRTQEALNEAHMALYAVDASMMSASGAAVDPSLEFSSVQLSPTSAANSAPGAGVSRVDQAGRMTAQMQQDTHGIRGPVRTLAESTGGRAINKGSDLKLTLDGIETESVSLYEVAFNPDTPADNKFHTLQLKAPGRKDVKLRYRTAYLYNEEATDTKQRFHDAVWSPQDLSGISLTAEALPGDASSEATLKLRINFTGINFQQKGDRWADDLYIFIAQRDDAAQKAQVTGDTLRLSLKQGSYDSGMPAGIPYRHTVDAKSKLGSVRVIVVDGNSGKMGTVTLPSSALKP